MQCDGIYYLGKFKKRPNRFLAEVVLDSPKNSERIIEAHVPDPGRLEELLLENAQIILRKSTNSARKTQYSLVGIKQGKVWVNIDSQLTNHLFKEEYQKIQRFQHLKMNKSEFPYRSSRFDFLMEDKRTHQKALIEVKSVTLVKNGIALFPDAPTTRGTKHIMDLTKAVNKYQVFMIFIVKRNDVTAFKPNEAIDPTFSQALIESMEKGLQICSVKCLYDPIVKKELKILEEIPLVQ